MTQDPPQPWPGDPRPPDPWAMPRIDPLSGLPVTAAYEVPPAPYQESVAPQQIYPPGAYPPGPDQSGPYQSGPYQSGPYQYGPYPPPYGWRPAPPTNGMAIAALVLGIIWVYWLGSILAIVFGFIARSQIRRTGEGGDGMAVAGLVLGFIGIGVLALVIILPLSIAAFGGR